MEADFLKRQTNETPFEHKLRLCLAKKRGTLDVEWAEIVEACGLTITVDQLRKQAVGYFEYDEYVNGFGNVATTILSVSDLHVPFQLPIEELAHYAGKVDILQINGDVVDCQALSKFPKNYRISPMDEMIQGREYLINLIRYVSPKKVICNYGNHDIRFQNYFSKNIDTDILELMPRTSLELMFVTGFNHYDKRTGTKTHFEPISVLFDDIDIEFVDDWKVRVGNTLFVHPLAYRSGILATADKAKAYFQDVEEEPFDCIVMAHTHSIGDTKKGRIRLLEQGAFCYVDKMHYGDGKLNRPQKEGFAIICQDINGNLIQDKTKVVSLN